MQDRELYINGNLIQLSDITRIGVTYQANNLGELQNRQGTFTNTFKIPVTDSNMVALEFANLMTSNTAVPYRKNLGTYKENGIDLVSDGEAILKMTDLGHFLIDIVGGNMDISRAIGDLIVGELYADDIVYVWDLQNVYDSRDGSKYFIYPLIDWRTDINTFFTTIQADARQMLPCATIPSLFNRLESYTGFTFVGAYLDSDEHNEMILTPSDFSLSDESLLQQTTKAEYYPTGNITIGQTNPWVSQVIVPEGSGTVSATIYPRFIYADPDFFTVFAGDGLTASYFPVINQIATLKFTGVVKVDWEKDGTYGIFESNEERNYYFVSRIKENGVVIAEITSDTITRDLWGGDDEHVINVTTGEVLLQVGLEYFCQIDIVIQKHSNIDSVLTMFSAVTQFSHEPSRSLVYGNDINFRDLFRMKVSDVLKDILNLRGVIIQTNSYTKEVQFNYFQDLIDNKPIAKNWSKKIDVRQMQTEYKFGKYAQRNWFRFKENDSVTNELGDYYFDVDDQTLEAEDDAVKINHPATEEQNRYLGYNIPMIEGIDSLNKWQKPEWRILQAKQQNTSFNVDFIDGVDTFSVANEIPITEFIGFEELVPEFYQTLIDILQRTKSIILPVELTAIEISELDFVIPIFLDIPELDISDYFYINQISNYKSGFTPVQFIRL